MVVYILPCTFKIVHKFAVHPVAGASAVQPADIQIQSWYDVTFGSASEKTFLIASMLCVSNLKNDFVVVFSWYLIFVKLCHFKADFLMISNILLTKLAKSTELCGKKGSLRNQLFDFQNFCVYWYLFVPSYQIIP